MSRPRPHISHRAPRPDARDEKCAQGTGSSLIAWIRHQPPGSATAQLLLNCPVSDSILISTGESVRFHIELPILADAVAGAATLSWAPIEPTGTPIVA